MLRRPALAFVLLGLLLFLTLRVANSLREDDPSIGSIVTEHQFTRTPFGYTLLCRKHPDWCTHLAPIQAMQADAAVLDRLDAINAAVNAAIRYRPDRPQPFEVRPVPGGPPHTIMLCEWTVEPAIGDCEDYAVTKLARLLAAGFPRSALRLVIARIAASGTYHAVLAVETDRGTLILDNRHDEIRRWDRITDLRWLAVEWVAPSGMTFFHAVRGIDPDTGEPAGL